MQLDVKGMALLLPPSLVPIQVDANLTDGNDGVLVKHGAHLAEHVKVVVLNILGVQAQRHGDVVGVLLMQRGKTRHALQILVGKDNVAHTRLTGTLDNGIAVLVKGVAIDV